MLSPQRRRSREMRWGWLALAGTALLALHTGTAAASGPLRIAYTGPGSHTAGVCTVAPDGGNNVCVSDGTRPAPWPDGGSLLFISNQGGDPSADRVVYREDADGSNVRLVSGPYADLSAGPETVDVSTDGRRITYDRWVGNGPFATRQIYVANADGSGERQLTNLRGAGPDGPSNPTLSPDAKTVLFFDCPGTNAVYGNVCAVPAAGGAVKLLITGGDHARFA